ncbi:transmembrane signal receptor [Lithospermum erythrorhizon]|uniref:Transmembrane signal receptor n=1 Tax=Lithospermum erythrorhizon TaxID=34254 RepID=A0AAV3Q461_LITER
MISTTITTTVTSPTGSNNTTPETTTTDPPIVEAVSTTSLIVNPKFLIWVRQDQLVMSWLFSSLSTPVLARVVKCTTSFQLHTTKKGTLPMADYVEKMNTIIDNLSVSLTPVSDIELVSHILDGLDSDYDSLITSVYTRGTAITVEELTSLILQHEARMTQRLEAGISINYAAKNNQYHKSFKSSQSYQSNNNASRRYVQSSSNDSSSKTALIATPSTIQDPSWYIDSGATNHITADLNNLSLYHDYHGSDKISVGNGQTLPINHTGKTSISAYPNKYVHLNNILHVPQITKNLLSVSQLAADNNVYLEFHAGHCFVKDLQGRILLQGKLDQGLYRLESNASSQDHSASLPKPSHFALVGEKTSFDKWHERLGHPAPHIVQKLVAQSLISTSNPVNKLSQSVCASCQLGKSHRFHLPASTFVSTAPLELVYSDVWGKSPVVSNKGFQYYVHFTDHFTKYVWFYPMKSKSEVYQIFNEFKAMVETKFERKIKTLQSDWGGEYRNLNLLGITHQLSCPHTPSQNGAAERKHRHIVETGLTLLAKASMPLKYWDDAFSSAVYLINRLPNKSLDYMSPYQKVCGRHPQYNLLKVFGCRCYPYLRPYNKHKLHFRSLPCIFTGYSFQHKGYKCFHLASGREYIVRHVVFDEQLFPFAQGSTTSVSSLFFPNHVSSTPLGILTCSHPSVTSYPNLPSLPSPITPTPLDLPPFPHVNPISHSSSPILQSTVPPSSEPSGDLVHVPIQTDTPPSQPAVTIPVKQSLPLTRMVTRSQTNSLKPRVFNVSKYPLRNVLVEPSCYSQAKEYPEWQTAMQEEYDALVKNQTWSLVPAPSHHNIVNCKWIYRVKKHADGSFQRCKARLVATGVSQQYGVDYFETFSPVVKATTIRIVLHMAVSLGWNIRQVDVNNAFLHGLLSEEVYMKQPPGFKDTTNASYVCKLHKAIYGLKQAPRAWFHRLSARLIQIGFKSSSADSSLFIKSQSGQCVFLLVYVDDIIITGHSTLDNQAIIDQLHSEFALKDLGSLHYFLGIEVLPTPSGLHLNQSKYLAEVLERVKMDGAKPLGNPCTTEGQISSVNQEPFSDPTMYRSTVGALQYLTITRPDIAFAVNKACQFMQSPSILHWQFVKRILRYLKGSVQHGILIQPSSSFELKAYTDADWAGCPDTRRSTSGFVIFMGNSLISWSSRKQKVVARSSTEAEYRSLALCTAELMWIQKLLKELHVISSSSPTLFCDNLGATYLSVNLVLHSRIKHVEIDICFVRERVTNGALKVQYVPTLHQIADVLTKGLSTSRFHILRSKLNVVSPQFHLRGGVRSYEQEHAKEDSKSVVHDHVKAGAKDVVQSLNIEFCEFQ